MLTVTYSAATQHIDMFYVISKQLLLYIRLMILVWNEKFLHIAP